MEGAGCVTAEVGPERRGAVRDVRGGVWRKGWGPMEGAGSASEEVGP